MPSKVFTSAGTNIAISAVLPATNDVLGYEALTFTDLDEVTDLGEFGRVYNEVTHTPLKTRAVVKRKGSYNDGNVTMQLARIPSDAGQTILIAAVDDDADHAFAVTLQDGSVLYFQGQVMSFTTNVGGPDQIVGASVTIGINSEEGIVEDPAA
jgi:hypothetical protein